MKPVRDPRKGMVNPIADLQRVFAGPPKPLVTGPPSAPSNRYYQDPFYLTEVEARADSADRTLTGPEIQLYVTDVQRMGWPAWYPRACWPVRVTIADTRTPAYNSGTITTPSPVRELIVLHEMAHHFAGTRPADPHDGLFVRAFLDLIERVRNPVQAQHFRTVFTAHGVRW